MNKIFLFSLSLFAVLSIQSCKDDSSKEEVKTTSIEEQESFVAIEELFRDTEFKSEDQKSLLKELNICSWDTIQVQNNPQIPFCSAANFKFFPLRKDLSEKNGFILLIKAETGGFPLRRLLIFQRERGKLVKANGFVANLIGRYPSQSGYDDLLLRFVDKDGEGEMFYNCLFTWIDGQYQYKQVEVIEGPNWGGAVKAEFKDSISKEIYQNILNNQMVF